MPLFILRNNRDWVEAADGEGGPGPSIGFDTDLGRPVWRHPTTGCWVDATGTTVTGMTGYLMFELPENSALLLFA